MSRHACEVLEPMFMDMDLVPCGRPARVRLRDPEDGREAWMCRQHVLEFEVECVVVRGRCRHPRFRTCVEEVVASERELAKDYPRVKVRQRCGECGKT